MSAFYQRGTRIDDRGNSFTNCLFHAGPIGEMSDHDLAEIEAWHHDSWLDGRPFWDSTLLDATHAEMVERGIEVETFYDPSPLVLPAPRSRWKFWRR